MAMSTYEITLHGVHVSFEANVDLERVEAARALVIERFDRFIFNGRQSNREKTFTYVSLGLADDLLQLERQNAEMRERLEALLAKIQNVDSVD